MYGNRNRERTSYLSVSVHDVGEKEESSSLALGMTLGIALGAALGVAVSNLALGIGLGLALGVAIPLLFVGGNE